MCDSGWNLGYFAYRLLTISTTEGRLIKLEKQAYRSGWLKLDVQAVHKEIYHSYITTMDTKTGVTELA